MTLWKYFKFIDNLNVLSYCVEFERSFHEIYPPKLELKKENLDYLDGSFLDLMIIIKDKRFFTKLFDKRDSFLILILRMP